MKFFRSSQGNQSQPDNDPVQSFAPKPKGQGFYNDRKAMENFERQRRASIEMHRQAPHLHPNTMVRRRQDHRSRIMRVKGRHRSTSFQSKTPERMQRFSTLLSVEKRTPPPVSAVTSVATERTDKTSVMSLTSVSATSSDDAAISQPSADWDDSAMPQFEKVVSSSKPQFDSFDDTNFFQQKFTTENHELSDVQDRFNKVEIREDPNGNVEGHMGQMGAKLELEASYDESEEDDIVGGVDEEDDGSEEAPLDHDIPLLESNSDSFAPVDTQAFEESSNLNPPEEGNFEVLSPTKPLQRARTQIGSVEVSLHETNNEKSHEDGMTMNPNALNLQVKEDEEDDEEEEEEIAEETDLQKLETAVSSTDSESTNTVTEDEKEEDFDDGAKVLEAEERAIEGVTEVETPRQEAAKSPMTEEEINVQEMARKLIKRKKQIHVPLPIGKSHSDLSYMLSRSGSNMSANIHHTRNRSELSAIKMKNNDTVSTASSSCHDTNNLASPSVGEHSPTSALSAGSSSPLRSVYSDDESESSEGFEDGSRGALFDEDDDESEVSPRGRTSLGSSYIPGPDSPSTANSYFSDNDEDLFEILGNEFMYMTSCGVNRHKQQQRRTPRVQASPKPTSETFLSQFFQFGGNR